MNLGAGVADRSFCLRQWLVWLAILGLWFITGCSGGPKAVQPDLQATIDRKIVEYPAETELKPFIEGLTAPTAIAFDASGTLLIAEGGFDGHRARIIGFQADGTYIEVYPRGRRFPFGLGGDKFQVHGPIGGMAVANRRIYVTHRDENGRGMITAFGYDGSHTTIVADLPAQGDYSVSDIALASNGRLYFGVGTVTNSGVVGIDNMTWLREYRTLADKPWGDLYLLGRRFDTVNPFAGIFGGTDIAVTAPFQPFGRSIETRIPHATNGKPNAAVYSVDPNGGDLRVEAHGIRSPAGLGFSEPGLLYMTNQGMKLRGTRPVKDDPDVMLRMVHGQWYGWPDFSATLQDIRDPKFQPPVEMIVKSGYRDLSFLIDHERSGLTPPNPNSNLLTAEFRPLAGAAKFDFAPPSGPFSKMRQGGNVALVALMGDRAPFDSGGLKLTGPTGFKVVQVNVDDRTVKDFIRNTREGPASRYDGDVGLERPIDVKFGPDGAMYVLDFGFMEMKKGREHVRGETGKIYRLVGVTTK
ncbi:MAG TPA: hypothetical protein VGQ99_10825 [Tepidisphaeraceae bacterium]|jgi:glucose/arabinose dehydrogenase|nr:hypothetical protein [Tepidisphaeraceae bacterium]